MARRGGFVALALAVAAVCGPVVGAAADEGAGASTYCVKWRATARCDPHGVREPQNDKACGTTVLSGLSGYCECENRRRVREVACEHHEFTCEEACAQDSSADLTCAACI